MCKKAIESRLATSFPKTCFEQTTIAFQTVLGQALPFAPPMYECYSISYPKIVDRSDFDKVMYKPSSTVSPADSVDWET